MNNPQFVYNVKIKPSDLVDSKELDKLFSALNWFVKQFKAN